MIDLIIFFIYQSQFEIGYANGNAFESLYISDNELSNEKYICLYDITDWFNNNKNDSNVLDELNISL